jgi:hypothetical protein
VFTPAFVLGNFIISGARSVKIVELGDVRPAITRPFDLRRMEPLGRPVWAVGSDLSCAVKADTYAVIFEE